MDFTQIQRWGLSAEQDFIDGSFRIWPVIGCHHTLQYITPSEVTPESLVIAVFQGQYFTGHVANAYCHFAYLVATLRFKSVHKSLDGDHR